MRPISRSYGLSRGRPVDRFYIERFLRQHAGDIHGRALEFGDDSYLRSIGAARVTHREIMAPRMVEGAPTPTIIADLTRADLLPADAFDCIVCTQVLMFVFDVHAAIRSLHHMLRPGGVLLLTVAGISQICRYDSTMWGDYWRFTSASMQRLLEDAFGRGAATVESHGNVLAAVAFLHGLAQEDLTHAELEHRDRDYELVITARAVKPERPA